MRDTTFYLDVALKIGDKTMMLLEVKLHTKSINVPKTQVDEMYALGYHITLLKRGIRVGALHLYTSRQPPEPVNRWTAVAYLPPQPQQVFTHVGDAINRFLEKLKVRRDRQTCRRLASLCSIG